MATAEVRGVWDVLYGDQGDSLLPEYRAHREDLSGIASLCEGVGIWQVARIFEVDVNTVLGWLGEASGHVRAVSRYLLHELHVTQVQLDELYALLGVREEEGESAKGTSRRGKRRHCWLWGAIDAESKLLVAVEIGDRSLQTAQRVVHVVATVLAPGGSAAVCE
jgi:hypothetical protein